MNEIFGMASGCSAMVVAVGPSGSNDFDYCVKSVGFSLRRSREIDRSQKEYFWLCEGAPLELQGVIFVLVRWDRDEKETKKKNTLFTCWPDGDGENERSLLEDLVMRRNSIRPTPSRETTTRWLYYRLMADRLTVVTKTLTQIEMFYPVPVIVFMFCTIWLAMNITLPLVRSNSWDAQFTVPNDPRYTGLETNLGIEQAQKE
ncbi:hypothetical protein TNCV_4287761 [Trichonephila clavipes]|uniref:Uncharacterized protein n=1 Tax=Trichonephila clavipes TaxID=2585209 RepID=A0A8X6SAN2_TRICX|nr:hypothetical protein TNCV_4287761 [Trichonephila clavipes]